MVHGRPRIDRLIPWISIALVLAGIAPMVAAAPGEMACRGLTGPKVNEPMSVDRLARHGGFIYLFNHRMLIDKPFECASYYLTHGLNIDARDMRPGHPPLTALTYAVKQNDLKLAGFLIEHGASLKKPAGRKHLEPLAFAYHLSLSDTSINRNAMIGLLNDALNERAEVASR